MSDPAPLEPVDTDQCQCEEEVTRPFVMGGNVKDTTRCSIEPTVVITEIVEDEHGQQGAMSMCNKHLLAFVKKKGMKVMNYRLEGVDNWLEERASA